jgi:CRISPR-associated endonuclease Csy4
MMDYYIDIKLMPNKEIRENVLLNQVYTEFHKRLYDINAKNIAVSFPNYRLKLGDIFRIHGTKEALLKLNEKDWLLQSQSFCKISEIKIIPENIQHRTISRVQQTMSQSKLRRLVKRAEEGKGGIKPEDVKKYKIQMLQGGLENPFVELVSGSNGERHRRFIAFGTLQESGVEGEFDLFGLSKTSTIPWF